jgi:hypothetical protein
MSPRMKALVPFGFGVPFIFRKRLLRGRPGIIPRVVGVQQTKLASQGAEEFFIQGYRDLGAPLRNVDNALSFDSAARTQSSLSKIEAFFDELHNR